MSTSTPVSLAPRLRRTTSAALCRRLACFLAMGLVAGACSVDDTKDDGAGGSGGTAGSGAGCQPDEICCQGTCAKVECRSNATRCMCAASDVLAGDPVANGTVVASCDPPDGGGCCHDSQWNTCTCDAFADCAPPEVGSVTECTTSVVCASGYTC